MEVCQLCGFSDDQLIKSPSGMMLCRFCGDWSSENLWSTPDEEESSEWDELQNTSVARILKAVEAGKKSIIATAPTGFGKTRIASMLVKTAESKHMKWVFYTHRRLLFAQTHRVMQEAGVNHGLRASGYDPALAVFGQLSMLPTENAKLKAGSWDLHEANLVIWDEAHAVQSGYCADIFRHHRDAGAIQIGLTATPVGLGHLWNNIITLATISELRAVGGAVLAEIYAPDEFDMLGVKRQGVGGEFSPKEMGERVMVQQVAGSVIEHMRKLNPDMKPSLIFAPSVKASMWMTDQFIKEGIRAVHIDGSSIYFGEKDANDERVLVNSTQEMRMDVAAKNKSGELPVVCNRFVFREGVDWPWLTYGVFACAFGTEAGWIQSCGRLLRAHPGKTKAIIADHGGNVFRPGLGSPNLDRDWELEDNDCRSSAPLRCHKCGKSSSKSEWSKHGGRCPRCGATKPIQEKQPVCCPECRRPCDWAFWSANGNKCPFCGAHFTHSVRRIIQTDGKLLEVRDDPNVVKVKKVKDVMQKAWDSAFFASRNSKSPHACTFSQLKNLFNKRNREYQVELGNFETRIVDTRSGRRIKLHRIPPPQSSKWTWKVRDVEWRSLQ